MEMLEACVRGTAGSGGTDHVDRVLVGLQIALRVLLRSRALTQHVE